VRIADFVPMTAILHRLAATDARGAVTELALALAKLNSMDPALVGSLLLEREALGSTGIGHGIAVPHAKLEIPRTIGVLGLSVPGIDFAAPDGEPAQIFIALLSPAHGGAHLKALAAVAQDLSDATFRSRLLEAAGAAEVHRLLSAPRSAGRP
jgi:PTS system nitrogen regulatory IIA component